MTYQYHLLQSVVLQHLPGHVNVMLMTHVHDSHVVMPIDSLSIGIRRVRCSACP